MLVGVLVDMLVDVLVAMLEGVLVGMAVDMVIGRETLFFQINASRQRSILRIQLLRVNLMFARAVSRIESPGII